MRPRLSLLALLALAAIAFPAGASALSLSGTTTVQADCLHAVPLRLILLNDSDNAQSISLGASGDYSKWVEFAQQDFELGPGQSAEVVAFAKPDCYARDGNYQVGVMADGLQLGLLNIEVHSARKVSVSVLPQSAEASQCGSAAYTITVSNSGQLEENVLVSVLGLPAEWLSFQSAGAVMAPGSSKQFALNVSVPCNAKAGLMNASVSARHENGTAEASFALGVKGVQGNSVSLPAGAQFCIEEGGSAGGTIKNNSGMEDQVELSVRGAQWAGPLPRNFSLQPNEERSFEIVFQKNAVADGNYTVELVARSAKFDSSVSGALRARAMKCYALETKEEYVPRKACAGENTKFAFVLTNIGQKDLEATVSLSGVKVAGESQKKESIRAGGTAIEEFWLDTNSEKAEKKSVVFAVQSQYYSVDRNYSFIIEDCNGASAQGAGAEGDSAKPQGGAPLAGLVTGIGKVGLKTIATVLLAVIIVAVLAYLAVERKKAKRHDLGELAGLVKGGSQTPARKGRKSAVKRTKGRR